jgi:uncharacterized protein (UPF0332 family)
MSSKASELFAKADIALASAKLLLAAQDTGGACNRAYYAMFDAARAALLAAAAPAQSESVRTHSGLITAFSLHLVKTGMVHTDLGRLLNRVQELRLVADYQGDPVDTVHAQQALDSAVEFVTTVKGLFLA